MILRDRLILIFKLVRTLNVHNRALSISEHYKTIPLLMKNTILFLVCISKIQKSSENQKIFASHMLR